MPAPPTDPGQAFEETRPDLASRASIFIGTDPGAQTAVAEPEKRYRTNAPYPPEPRSDLTSALLAWARIDDDQRFPIDRIRYDDKLRFRIPAADAAAIFFDLGSATPSPDQIARLAELGRALSAIVADDPEELFLVEGHSDLTGTDYGNLILSDRRAEAVTMALTQSFGVPAANLVPQGYGCKHPLLRSRRPERRNRRVVLRRITMLIEPGYLLAAR
ncbi:MAG: OmpA family protein [Bauldia sp.]|nr:OmpA family protein [Bauldia sp.]